MNREEITRLCEEQVLGQMHRLAKTYRPPSGAIGRPAWHACEEYQGFPYRDQLPIIGQKYDQLVADLHALPEDVDSYGLIHNDFDDGNFTVDYDNGDITVFDFDTPKGRRDLKIAAVAPNGDFAAFCGMFYEPQGRFAMVEPVATDPTYRRLGLGKAAVLEGIRRCTALGATVAYVGSDQQFYRSIGFTNVYNSECWLRYFDRAGTGNP